MTSRLNRVHRPLRRRRPPTRARGRPSFDVTGALQVCPSNASSLGRANDEPGLRFTAPNFAALAPELAPGQRARHAGDHQPRPRANPHAKNADPVGNLATNGGACPVEQSPGGLASAGPGVATYDSQALTRDFTMLGQTRVVVVAHGHAARPTSSTPGSTTCAPTASR